MVDRQLSDVVVFLRQRELLHIDGHFGNLRAGPARRGGVR
jgi:hypothetical protein